MPFENNGEISTVPGEPSADAMHRHLKVLDGMIPKALEATRKAESDWWGTPRGERTAVQEAQMKMLDQELERLIQGRKYWKKRLDDEQRRLLDRGANPVLLNEYEIPDDIHRRGIRYQASELKIPVPAPSDYPSERVDPNAKCVIPKIFKQSKEAEEEYRRQLWYDYHRDVQRKKDAHAEGLEAWATDHYYWEQRKKKAAEKGSPFTESEPPKPPKPILPPPPVCDPPEN